MSIEIFVIFREFRRKGECQLCSDTLHVECEPVCKPGSVLSDHLSVALRCRSAQAASSERPGRPSRSSTALLRIEFTARTCLHAAGGRLSPPFHPYCHGVPRQRYISVALVRGSPLAGVTRYPCPMEPGLSSRTSFRNVPAVARPAHMRDCNCFRFGCQQKHCLSARTKL